ncbi:F-box protein SKIP27-like [Cornus florida]|uniref:F-box protein SKIP27-like n=1 Tax=Cornus florida TaxID=4283 RepID=UPI002899E9C4|nr:F-box protein SKIP27-like [Cornus florida]
MAMGKRCGSNGSGLGFVQYTRSLSRKRIVISNNLEVDSTVSTPTKKQCSEISVLNYEKSLLEALPQDILIRILCGVTHDDLKQLIYASKLIKEATLIAKKWHFAYSTPTKSLAFRNSIDLEDSSEADEVEAPNAPKQLRCYRPRVSGKKLANISVALFASPGEEQWPRKELIMDMEADI